MALKRDFSQHGSDAGKRFICCMEIPVDHPSGIGGTGATLIDKLPSSVRRAMSLSIPTMR